MAPTVEPETVVGVMLFPSHAQGASNAPSGVALEQSSPAATVPRLLAVPEMTQGVDPPPPPPGIAYMDWGDSAAMVTNTKVKRLCNFFI